MKRKKKKNKTKIVSIGKEIEQKRSFFTRKFAINWHINTFAYIRKKSSSVTNHTIKKKCIFIVLNSFV